MTGDTGDELYDATGDGTAQGGTEGMGEGEQMSGSGGGVDGPLDEQGGGGLGEGLNGMDAGATRANGLTAAYYVPLRDVDPRVGVELLSKLGNAGIAAYVAPTPGKSTGYGDVQVPPLPTDRLWVDGAQRTQAEAVIAGTISEDEVFDQLVAMFHASAPAVAPWPATEELSAPGRTPGTWTTRRSITARQSQPPVPQPPVEPALPEHVEAYLDEHFVPEPPPPLPRLHAITLVAWAAILLGVLMIVFHDSLGDFQQGSTFLAACGIGGGFATLVYRMRDDDRDDDGDGAVV
jgi:hypothetical protein